MDPSLKEKLAFFKQLDACKDCDDESDALTTEEQALRQQCKAFHTPAAASSLQPLKPKFPVSGHRRTTSAPAAKPVNDELEIIAVTPRLKRPAAVVSSPTRGVSSSATIIPETEPRPNTRSTRRKPHPPTPLHRSRSDTEPSSSITMAKRKRAKPLQMAPQSDQIFKRLCFFYVPNDDINPARRLRITKAREHGAIWTRNPTEATHVIVDKGLSYDDIKPILDNHPTLSSLVLVNDRYPIECLRRGVVFDPNPTVEKYQYKVPGDPRPAEEAAVLLPSTQDSDMSLQIQSRRDIRSEAYTVPKSAQGSSDPIRSSYPEDARLPELVAGLTSSVDSRASSELCAQPETFAIRDELTSCIDAVLDDPEKHEYLDDSDDDTADPENEGPSKKKAKGRIRPGKNGMDTTFSHDKFMCMKGGTKEKKHSGPNADTIKLLEEMAEEHILSNETWRVQSYRKAVATLRRQPKKIKTAKEATALPNIGSSIAEHIEEIVTTKHFEKLDQVRGEPSRKALKIFCNIYGVGVSTAKKWVEMGCRTLEDLRSTAKLTANQKIGLDHYDDLLTRIPRAEVKALGDHVKDVAAAIDPGIELIIGGSYRRGAETSGDVDIIITKKATTSTQDLVPFLNKLVDTLTKEGFLTAALASHRQDGGNKWHGCCILPAAAFLGTKGEYRPVWRRIDLLLVPETDIGAALIYFTGNDLFNRSLRLLARKKKMKLNHRALSGVGAHEGRDERKIFEILGVQWREPHERWC